MEQIQLSISPAQMTKIRKGMPIQIKHGSMGNGDVIVSLHPENTKKMMSAFKRGKGLRLQMNEDEVRASGIFGSLKKLGKKVEKGVVDAGNKVAKPTKKIISQIPKPIRDVLQDEAQGLIDTTGTTLGMMIGQATGDEELGDMINQGISDTGNELLTGQRLSLGSKILPIAKKSVNVVVDQIEDPRYRALAKQIVKKSGAGLYGKAGSGLTGKGLTGKGLTGKGLTGKGLYGYGSGSGLTGKGLTGKGLSGYGLSGSGMREEDMGRIHTLPYERRPAVMPPKSRFKKGSPEAKAYMASIRNNKEGSGFFKNIGKDIKKAGKKGKTALFGKRMGDEAAFVLPIAGTVLGATAGSMAGGAFGGAAGGVAGGAGGKYLADDINKRGYGMKVKGRRNSMVRPASDVPTFSPYATLYSPQNHPFMPRSSFQNGGTGELIM